ncbi:2-deoxy-D-gluconate 3-dehydrogenase [Polymorphobacter multimanifer]|uniref:Meso-butanediol dehydrogenase/(S,S)-butanediol dehydrogenase/diacetyl reductase n=1 Tax=Polymorphobacter multimanifer TaxID=1070431 RepID=A0A841L4W6_9SPHN|nr:SDR family NAD(P)-dependent oxidoreductase [Polymorphobacter multimanifer]MBB6227316.1 meso-butanediol dehydrogenase/(S,S)-butanediol dehydrogenase/diacetyl reductase [Polymorphobacter multimanifer]GGI83331.1 2-deoxy-D-gluconate 3-dehydrogenase [Polymorphobacter multimanifer]
MRRFGGKVVIVTGSGRPRGLGQAILQRFADEGAHCVVSDVSSGGEGLASSADMAEVVADLEQRGAQVLVQPCDVAKEAECEALVAAAVARFGWIDVMVNNAGIGFVMKPLLETSGDDWDRVLDVNLKGAFLASRAAARQFIAQGPGEDGIAGRIINIASQAAKSGFPHMAPYTASKHGMVGLTRSNAVELGPHRITVNAVCPNHVTTGLGAAQNEYFSKLLGFASVDAYLANMRAKNPLGRPGLASDTAAACAWLASSDAVYVTGEALNVSGGEEVH